MFILTEAGNISGYGHLTRCIAINQKLKKRAKIFVHPDNKLNIRNINIYPWRNNIQKVIKLNNLKKFKVALIDSYLVNKKILKTLRDNFKYLIILDDYDRITYDCDLIINPSILGSKFKLNQKIKKAHGSKYIIIRDEIKKLFKRKPRNNLKNLSIIFGKSNYSKNLFNKIISSLNKLELDRINILSGDKQLSLELKKNIKLNNLKIYGWLNANRVSSIFNNSDLVISSGGQTLNELAYLGVPFIAIETGFDQYWNIKGFVKKKITPIHFKATDKNLIKKLFKTVTTLKDQSKRSIMSSNGTKLIDGKGAFRIAKLLEKYS